MQAVKELKLTSDQQAALDAFYLFLVDPIETVFVLSGFSGCGKSTLVKTLLDLLPGYMKTVRLINPSAKELDIALTATTNKAAENLSNITGMEVRTIQSFLGLRVNTDFKTGVTTMVPTGNFSIPENCLLFIDEASFVDKALLGYVFSRTHKCKFVFIGDPAQLTPVKSGSTPVFNAGFTGAALTQVVRQAEGNPIVDFGTKFRHAVNTGEFFSFKPDGHHIRHLNRDDFNAAVAEEFTRPDWKYADSMVLGWTNKCAISYNQFVRNLAKGDPHFQEGDYAVCNNYLNVGSKYGIKTDQMVQITAIEADTSVYGVLGNWVILDNTHTVFLPKSLAAKNARIKEARACDDLDMVMEMETKWADLRGAYACTINKSQGSTYGTVFIDLDDVGRCNSRDQLARMLYVAVTRARDYVYLTGDIC